MALAAAGQRDQIFVPQETSGCKYWEYNEGDGLNGEQAVALADALDQKLKSGAVAFALYDPTLVGASPVVSAINNCLASEDLILAHPQAFIDEEFVAEFVAFVRASGRFSIW